MRKTICTLSIFVLLVSCFVASIIIQVPVPRWADPNGTMPVLFVVMMPLTLLTVLVMLCAGLWKPGRLHLRRIARDRVTTAVAPLTDSEVICSFMEPRPALPYMERTGTVTTQRHSLKPDWWRRESKSEFGSWKLGEWHPCTLDLDALREVQERLTDAQWGEYRGWFMVEHQVDGHHVPFGTYLLHAKTEQKISALAAVLRSTVEAAL